MDYSKLQSLINSAPEDFGTPGVLPTGIYPVEIAKATAKPSSKGTSVQLRLQLKVLDGPMKDSYAFVDHYLCNMLDPAQWEKQENRFLASTTTIIKILGITLAQDPCNNPSKYSVEFDSNIEAFVAALNVEETLAGKKFIAGIQLQTVQQQWNRIEKDRAAGKDVGEVTADQLRDKNVMQSWDFWDGKNGYETWKRRELPKQELQARRSPGPGTSGNSSAPDII